MRRLLFTLAAALAVATASPAKALRIAMPNQTTAQKATQADAVVVGKVTIEKDTVDAPAYEGAPNKVTYKVAVIRVDKALSGLKNVTAVKVLFQPTAEGGVDGPPTRLRPSSRPVPGGFGAVTLENDQEGVFFLTKLPTAPGYYQILPGCQPLNAADTNYKDELAQVKAIATAVTDPAAALKAEKVEDRVAALAALAQVYRSYPRNAQSGIAEVALPAEESKLILKTLKDADWTKGDPAAMPGNVAAAFGLRPGQYGMPVILPKAGEDTTAAARKAFDLWFAKHGEGFELTKFVAKEAPGLKAK